MLAGRDGAAVPSAVCVTGWQGCYLPDAIVSALCYVSC